MVCLLFNNSHSTRSTQRPKKCSFRRFLHWRRSKTKEQQQQENLALDFLCNACPEDVLTTVLAMAGPQTVSSLQRVNFKWYAVISRESTWRGLCEQLYKWKPGQAIPSSWKEYYRLNPCVPVDFASISSALMTAGAATATTTSTRRSYSDNDEKRQLRIWVRPGQYVTKESIVIQLSSNDHQVIIQKMETPSSPHQDDKVQLCSSLVTTRLTESTCMFRVTQGQLLLCDLSLQHQSASCDVQRHNTAIQVEGAGSVLCLEHCRISSQSGRGIVATQGTQVYIRDCQISNCRYSGLVVNDAECCIEDSDITNNCTTISADGGGGLGGHSQWMALDSLAGIFFTSGQLNIINSNISFNLSAGITVDSVSVARDHLSVYQTDFLQNIGAPIQVFGRAGNRIHRSSNQSSQQQQSMLHPRSSVFEQPKLQRSSDLERLRQAMFWLQEYAPIYGM